MQRRQHPEAEQVELHEPGGGAVVLVPLQHRAVLHPPPLDRAHLDHRAVADHHPAGVDAEVARGVLDLGGQVEHRPGNDPRSGACRGALVLGAAAVVATVPHPSMRFDQASCWPGAWPSALAMSRTADLARYVMTLATCAVWWRPCLLVDVLDDLLAPVALDVDVDVRRAVALGRQEALEQQAERHGVGGGDAEGVADRRVGGRPRPGRRCWRSRQNSHEVPHDEEVAGEAELLDDRPARGRSSPRPGPQRQVLAGAAGARRSGGGPSSTTRRR